MLDIQNLSKTFNAGTASQIHALRGVTLSIPANAFVVLVGTNGSGKSTLLNAIAGGVSADSGTIRVDDVDVTRWPEHRRAGLMGRVFQNPVAGTASSLSIAENLILASKRGKPRRLGWALDAGARDDVRGRVHELAMGLEDRLDEPMGSLSAGQRQAMTLLMATWVKPRLLLLDEHTGSLDPKTAEQVVRLTQELVSRQELTTLMVTHSMAQAVNLGDRVLMMHGGRIIHDFSGAEKERLRVEDLLARFEAVRRADLLDETAADMLRRMYV